MSARARKLNEREYFVLLQPADMKTNPDETEYRWSRKQRGVIHWVIHRDAEILNEVGEATQRHIHTVTHVLNHHQQLVVLKARLDLLKSP